MADKYCRTCGHYHNINVLECADDCVQCQIIEAEQSVLPVDATDDDDVPEIPDASRNPVRGTAGKDIMKQGSKAFGRMSPFRLAWLETAKQNFILMVGMDTKYADDRKNRARTQLVTDPDAPLIDVLIRTPGRKFPTKISLSGMTEQELLGFGEFIRLAVARALPVVRHLDKKAQEAYVNGEFDHSRLYRPVPQVFVRERSIEEHAEGVQIGFDGPLRECPNIFLIYDPSESGPPRLIDGLDIIPDQASGVDYSGIPEYEKKRMESEHPES